MDTKNFFRQNIKHHHFLLFFWHFALKNPSLSYQIALLSCFSKLSFLSPINIPFYIGVQHYHIVPVSFMGKQMKKKKEHRDVGKSCDSELVEEIESLFRFLEKWHLMAFLMPTLSKSRAIVSSYSEVGAGPPCSHMHQLIAIIGAHIAALAVHSSMH